MNMNQLLAILNELWPWVIVLWVFIPEFFHSGLVAGAPGNRQDAGSLRLINLTSDAAFVLALIVSLIALPVIPIPQIAVIVGMALVLAGGILRRVCFRALGRYFTPAVVVTPGQPVIDQGPYRWVRHPGYTAGFMIYTGLGLAINNWLSLAILFGAACLCYAVRVSAEEKALLDTLGQPYRDYMARTRRFIPFVY